MPPTTPSALCIINAGIIEVDADTAAGSATAARVLYDSDYESGSESETSSLLSSAAVAHTFENGRRYHAAMSTVRCVGRVSLARPGGGEASVLTREAGAAALLLAQRPARDRRHGLASPLPAVGAAGRAVHGAHPRAESAANSGPRHRWVREGRREDRRHEQY